VSSLCDLTEDAVLDYLKNNLEVEFESYALEDLDAAVKSSVRINVNESDPKMRIKMLFVDYKNFLRNRNWEELIDSNPKLAISHIVSLLKPTALKETIENDLALGKHDMRKQWLPFFRHLVKSAVDFDRYVSVKFVGSTCATKTKDRVDKDKVNITDKNKTKD